MENAKKIGPSFVDELAAHGGLMGEHFSWQPEEGTLEFFDDTPDAVRAGVEAVYAAHDPSTPAVEVPVVSVTDKLKAFLADNPDVAEILK